MVRKCGPYSSANWSMPIVGRAGIGLAFGSAGVGSGLRMSWGTSSAIGTFHCIALARWRRSPTFFPAVDVFHDAAGAVVAHQGDDDAVAGLEAVAGLVDPRVVLGLALEVGEPLAHGRGAPLGVGLGGEGRLPGFLGFATEPLHDLQLRAPSRPRDSCK